MTTTVPVTLSGLFASALPELAVPWQAEAAPDPQLLVLNEPLARELGLDPAWLRTPDGLGLLTGTVVPAGATPVAQGYAGHQFGHYSPRLGDGRALLLGELTDVDGRLRDLHLKGAGRTPFARGGDGLAAVGPMLRELVVSEALHALGIPTTRALAVTATGRHVAREDLLPGAVLARVASSHLRVGSFQYVRAMDDPALLQRLVDVAIARHHPEAADAEIPALALFEAVRDAQARLVAQWMGVGFVHGVQNTDNVTISGETIDYGPCAFLDVHDPAASFSSIDSGARYAYGAQPAINEWNLARLAEALLPLIDDDPERAVALATASLRGYRPTYEAAFAQVLAAKLGLAGPAPELAADLLALVTANHVDHTAFFRSLSSAARGDLEPTRGLVLDLATIDAWLARWLPLRPDPDAMDRVNPAYVPRNHLVEEALAAGTEGDLAPLHRLHAAVTDPFVVRPGLERYAAPSPADPGYRTFCGT